MLRCLPVLVLSAAVAGAENDPADWRLELLAEQGVVPDEASLRELLAGFAVSEDPFAGAVARLGADEFAVRQAAEAEILQMGRNALPLLRELPRQEDPEVRTRLEGITRSLSAKGRWARDELLHHAVDSLLREREGKPGAMLFAEFFGIPQPSLDDGYRRSRRSFEAGVIGRLDSISLDRSGRRGGDALFDDLVVDLGGR